MISIINTRRSTLINGTPGGSSDNQVRASICGHRYGTAEGGKRPKDGKQSDNRVISGEEHGAFRSEPGTEYEATEVEIT